MTKELTPQQKFQERIVDKLREDFSKLLPDEVLSSLVEAATHDIFFKKESYSEGWQTKYKDSWFITEVKDIFKKEVHKKAQEFIDENKDKLENAFLDVFKQSLPEIIVSFIVTKMTTMTHSSVMNNQISIVSQVEDILRKRGF